MIKGKQRSFKNILELEKFSIIKRNPPNKGFKVKLDSNEN